VKNKLAVVFATGLSWSTFEVGKKMDYRNETKTVKGIFANKDFLDITFEDDSYVRFYNTPYELYGEGN
jgi:hypothetical protein